MNSLTYYHSAMQPNPSFKRTWLRHAAEVKR